MKPEPRECAVLPGYGVAITYNHWNAPKLFLHEMLPAVVYVGDSGGVHEPELRYRHLVRLGEHAGICDRIIFKVELSLAVLVGVAQSDLVILRRICKPGRVFVEKAAILTFWFNK